MAGGCIKTLRREGRLEGDLLSVDRQLGLAGRTLDASRRKTYAVRRRNICMAIASWEVIPQPICRTRRLLEDLSPGRRCTSENWWDGPRTSTGIRGKHGGACHACSSEVAQRPWRTRHISLLYCPRPLCNKWPRGSKLE